MKLSKYSSELKLIFCESDLSELKEKNSCHGLTTLISIGISLTTLLISVKGAKLLLSGKILDCATLVVNKPKDPITNTKIIIELIVTNK